ARCEARAPHDLRRAIADAEPELVPSFAEPGRRPRGAVERELHLVAPSCRCLRQNARPLQSPGESDQQAGVILGLAAVQVAQLRDDGLHVATGNRLDEIEPMHADVGRRTGNAAARGIEPPVVVRSEQQPVLKEGTTGQMHQSEVPGADARRELSNEGKKAVVLADRGLAPAALRKLGELLASFAITSS